MEKSGPVSGLALVPMPAPVPRLVLLVPLVRLVRLVPLVPLVGLVRLVRLPPNK